MYYYEIEKQLTKNGWTPVRTLGSNCQFKKIGCKASVIVFDNRKELSPRMIEHLEKITGLSLMR